MAIEGILSRRKCAEKWCATFWDPVPQFSVSLNSGILNFQDFRHSWVSPFIIKWSLDLQMGPRSQGLLVEGAFGENSFWVMTPFFFFPKHVFSM